MTEAGRKFLEKKWRHFAYTMDHDKDGYVSREDHLDFANRAIEMGGIDPNSTQAVQIRRKILQVVHSLQYLHWFFENQKVNTIRHKFNAHFLMQ